MLDLEEQLVAVTDLKERTGEVLQRMKAHPDSEIILLRYGRPVAALVDYNRWCEMQNTLEVLREGGC